jgi:hypothetical protein
MKKNTNALVQRFFNHDTIRWTTLGILIIVFTFWFVIMGNCYLYGDMAESVGQAAGTTQVSEQHTLFIVLFLRLFWGTGNAIFIYNVVTWIGLILAMWFSLCTLNKLGVKWGWVLGLTLFYCFYPQYMWISSFSSKDQLISIAFLFLTTLFIRWTQKSKLELTDFIQMGVAIYFTLIFKMVDICIVFALLFLCLKFKKYWKNIAIMSIIAVVLALGTFTTFKITMVQNNNPLAVQAAEKKAQEEAADPSNTNSAQEQKPDLGLLDTLLSVLGGPFSPTQQLAVAFENPNANIPQADREFFEYTSGNPQWYAQAHPILGDFSGAAIGKAHPYTQAEFIPHYWSICSKNLGDCFKGWFQQQMGFFIPKYWQGAMTNTPARPIMVSLSIIPETNKTEFLPTNYSEMPTAVSQRFCNDPSFSGPMTDELYKQCFVKELGEQQGNLTYENVKQYIKQDVYDKQINPGLAKGLVHFWAHDNYEGGEGGFLAFFSTLMLDGFWLFWAVVIMLIIAYRKKMYKFIPAIWIPTSFYIFYLIFSPVAYERYVWPMFMIIPFLITCMSVKEKFMLKSAKKFNQKKK